MVKVGKMTKIQEKRINRQLNMWIRLPGIVTFLPLSYVCWAAGPATYVPWPILCIQSLLNLLNGVYFADRVVANAAVVEFKLKDAKKKEESR